MKIGQYTVVRLIGEGGMALVYEGRTAHGARVALKVLKRSYSVAPDLRARFLREASLQHELGHCPYICRCHEIFAHDDHDVVVLDYLEGQTLQVVIEKERPPVSSVAKWAQHVLTALSAAHALDVVHRDVKPGNIIVTNRGDAVLTDFGIAHTRDSTLTRYGQILGSLPYMSPEQLRGCVSKASDIYSLGVTLYETLTGTLPFGSLSDELAIQRAIKSPEPYASVRTRAPHVPMAIANFVDKAIAKDAAQRYACAAEALQALRTSLGSSEEVLIPQPGGKFVPLEQLIEKIGQRVKDLMAGGKPAARAPARARVVAYAGDQFHAEFTINGKEFIIGRDPQTCHLVIHHQCVSRRHAVIRQTAQGTWEVLDLSTNGTYVNGKLVGKNKSAQLRPGDKITCTRSLKYSFSVAYEA